MIKRAIVDALDARYNAQIAEAEATIKIYLEQSVGIGEHPQHLDEVDKQIQKISEAEEKLKILEGYKLWQKENIKNISGNKSVYLLKLQKKYRNFLKTLRMVKN